MCPAAFLHFREPQPTVRIYCMHTLAPKLFGVFLLSLPQMIQQILPVDTHETMSNKK